MVRFNFSRRSDHGRASGLIGKLGISLFFLFFFALGTFFEVMIAREFVKVLAQRAWKAHACTILSSGVEDKGRNDNPYVFAVRYEYEFGSKRYESRLYKRGYRGSDEYHEAHRLVERYPAGQESRCYVNPANPSEAVLKRGSLLFGFIALFPLIFVLIGAGGLYAIWFLRGGRGKGGTVVAKAGRKKGKRGSLLFFSIFALVGGGMLYPLGIRPILKTVQAESWEQRPCKILRARVRSHDSDDGTTYSVDIFYEYEFAGRTYRSSRYGFIGGSSSGYSGKKRIVDRYKKAKNPVCYVNPKDPSEAVLKRGLRPGLLVCLIPLPFLAVGVGGLVWTLGRKGRASRASEPQWLPRAGAASQPEAYLRADGDSGPVVLRPRYSPMAKLLRTVALALFWNGIVSIFVYQAVQGFRRGRPEWFLTVFMVPFVLVGLAIIAGVFYQLLALLNPRPVLRLSSRRIPLGGAAELSWEFSGRAGLIRRLRIVLNGREEATYRRGTKTRTDKNVFYELPLVETEQRHEVRSGQVGLVIPPDTMHSFEAANNKIVWELEVHGDIKRWPDVKESFKITVAPAPV